MKSWNDWGSTASGGGHRWGGRPRALSGPAPYSWTVELDALGIGGHEEVLYRRLIEGGPATAEELRALCLVPGESLAGVLAALVASGLAAREGESFRAAPPELALRSLLVRRRSELGRAENAMAELTELFRTAATGSVRDLVEVVTGVEGVRQRFHQVQSSASSSVHAFVRADPQVVPAAENPAEEEALGRGVQYSIVLERAVLEAPGALASVEESVAAGEEVRTVDRLPLRMVIADRTTALVPLASEGEPGAVVVHQSGLLDALLALFHQTWERAVPVVNEPVGEGELDGRIVALLLQGYGDQSISGQLAVSPRTVQRRIRSLMDQAGVSTRVQLGYWLGQRD